LAKAHNPRRAKQHRSYNVAEAAALFAVHRNTVRNWMRRGLPVVQVEGLTLILGSELRAFLHREAASRRRKCQPGQLYCLRCREPRAPAPGSAEFVSTNARSGNLAARCGCCGARMFRRVALSKIAAIGFAGVGAEAGGSAPS
jgi:hypothetical protein